MLNPHISAIGRTALTLGMEMTRQSLRAVEMDDGPVAELKRLGATPDLLLYGDQLSVALHRVAAEFGHPAILKPSGVPYGRVMACLDVAGCAAASLAALMRNAPHLAEALRNAPTGHTTTDGAPGGGGSKLRRVA